MSLPGIEAVNLTYASAADAVLVVRTGSSRLIETAKLGAQLGAVSGPTYETRAQLYADLAWAAGSAGKVVGDSTPAWRGVYKKSGASGSGSWARIGPLPEADAEGLASEIIAARQTEADLATNLTGMKDATTALVNDLATMAGTVETDVLPFVGGYPILAAENGYLDGWRDAAGNIVAGINLNGHLETINRYATGVPALIGEWAYAKAYQNGKVLYAYAWDGTRYDFGAAAVYGGFERIVSGASVAYVTAGTAVHQLTFGWRDAFFAGTKGAFALLVEDFAGTLVLREEELLGTTTLGGSIEEIVLDLAYGQSGVDQPPTCVAISTAALRPGRAAMFNSGSRIRGSGAGGDPTPTANTLSLVDLADVGTETFGPMMAYEQTRDGALPATTGILEAGCGIGGVAYSSLAPGTQGYLNLLHAARRGKIIVGLNGLGFDIGPISWGQGESNVNDSLATYKAHMEALQAALTVDLNKLRGGSDEIVLCMEQISNWTYYNIATCEVPLAMLDLALTQPGKFLLVGPKYQHVTTDGRHLEGAGLALQAALHGRAKRLWRAGTPMLPLHVSSAVRTGASVVLTFGGGDLATDIALDTTLVNNPGNYGVTWLQTGGTPQTITGVTKTGARQLTVALTGDPGAPSSQRIGIAASGASGAGGGPTSGPRSNIRDQSPDTNYHGAPMYNWACHQIIAVS